MGTHFLFRRWKKRYLTCSFKFKKQPFVPSQEDLHLHKYLLENIEERDNDFPYGEFMNLPGVKAYVDWARQMDKRYFDTPEAYQIHLDNKHRVRKLRGHK